MDKKNNSQQEDGEIELLHRSLIEEEKIDVSKLPTDIQDLIEKFDKLEENYSENSSEDEFYALQELDATIADEIQTFIEDEKIKDEEEEEYDPDEEDENKNQNQNTNQNQTQMKKTENPKADADAKAKADADAKVKADADAKAKADADAKAKADADAAAKAKADADAKAKADADAEEEKRKKSPEGLASKLKAKLDSENEISNADLSALLGVSKAEETEYTFGNITVRRIYLGGGKYRVK